MAIYQMRYGKLMQFSMVIEVEANTLQQAMAMSHTADDQEWIEEEWYSDPRHLQRV